MLHCVKCNRATDVVKAGFVRGRQRFFCKSCDYHFAAERPAGAPSRQRRHATLADVARRVGVAPSTASRALNGHPDINPLTRQAILDAARQLAYQPNLLAQSLKSCATNTIGVVIPDLERPFFATAVSGIQQVATEAGYRVMICQSKESYATEVSNVQALVASQVDGLLICHSRETENFDHVSATACRDIPIVHFDRVADQANAARVIVDNWSGAFAVTEHLVLEGCRRIALLAGPASLLISQQRQAGYRSALSQYGQPVAAGLMAHSDFSPAAAVACLDAWLALPDPPDAIFCVNYTNALDLLVALRSRNRRVPQDIAIVGFGDEFLASLIEPSLTTVDLHPYRLGQQAAHLFLEQVRLQERFEPRTCVVASELIIRQSSRRGQGG